MVDQSYTLEWLNDPTQVRNYTQGFRVKEGLSCVLFRAVAARENTQLSPSLTRKPFKVTTPIYKLCGDFGVNQWRKFKKTTSGDIFTEVHGCAKEMSPFWKFPPTVQPGKLTCQCTNQSANFGKFWLNSLNLAPFLLLNPVDHLNGAQLWEVGCDSSEDGIDHVVDIVWGAAQAVLDVGVLPRLRQRRHSVQFAVQVGDLLGDVADLDLVLRLL